MIRKLDIVKAASEKEMRDNGYEDGTIILTLDELKFWRYNLDTKTFTPGFLSSITNNNVTNNTIGLDEEQALALFTPKIEYVYELIQRMLIQFDLYKIIMNDPVLQEETERAFKNIEL